MNVATVAQYLLRMGQFLFGLFLEFLFEVVMPVAFYLTGCKVISAVTGREVITTPLKPGEKSDALVVNEFAAFFAGFFFWVLVGVFIWLIWRLTHPVA